MLISWMLSWEIYRYITTLCLNGTLPCADFMGVIMGDAELVEPIGGGCESHEWTEALLGPVHKQSQVSYNELELH